ncbi:hypothetical protein GCM10017044_28010 [Kordiimonas sediminis]|uniref:Uncharacterized protein n=1 Tax=Kordiimonas sediminis TaxID=1735581 RepID=A0A919EBC5_9PROT|nr:hypothetical protein [Kordiimonas sediminis]GHF30993.1 hypothetical protein GCM10017044_28010 [Kordiimonas sediminis]
MSVLSKVISFLLIGTFLTACGQSAAPPESDEPVKSENILEITAKNMRFEGPATIKSGWTTMRLKNSDNMLHFALVAKLPDGITAMDYSDDLGSVFQAGYDAMMQGENTGAAEIFATIPAWFQDLTYHGGPGFTAGGLTTEATMYLEPGNYIIECYIKSNGVFHSASYEKGELAMLLPLTVLAEEGGMAEPEANAIFTIDAKGFHLSAGSLQAGVNSIKVNFQTQIRYPSASGQDIHFFKIDSPEDKSTAVSYMDWQQKEGLETPAPLHFVGGINDVMPAGSSAYFTLTLEPGTYGAIAEVPDADKKGMLLEFTITP